jgi:hypothetical protein
MDDQEKGLQVIEQKTVLFYEDEITAVVVDEDGRQQVYVPLRPICEYLGLAWSSQLQRTRNDAVLSREATSVLIATQKSDESALGPKTSTMICLPLDMINGWLFGINANRVREDLRDRLIRYQQECYRVLAQAFQSPAARSDASSTLMQVREMGLAIARMAEEQMEFDRRLAVTEGRVNQAAVVVADMRKRLTVVEQRLFPGQVVTDDQASQVSQAVKTVALALGKKSGRNEFGAVYGELYRKFGITGYKMLPASRFGEAMKFLTDWHGLLDQDTEGG